MRKFIQLAVGVGTALGVSVLVAPLGAGALGPADGAGSGDGASHVVFVQTDNTQGNQVVAYDRNAGGELSFARAYNTGGLGGILNGSAVDHLASQGSLTYDEQYRLLLAVNAGSNTVSVFSVHEDQLSLRQVVSSGGPFPVSIAVHHDLVYVLNAEHGGSVSGYRIVGGALQPIGGSVQSLGLPIFSGPGQFTHTPGQIAFSPDGTQVIVTTKASTNAILVFGVTPSGRLSSTPWVNAEPGTVPFAVTFDGLGHLVVAEAGTNALATFTLQANGTTTLLNALGTGQNATCWVAHAQGHLYVSNAASATVSGYRSAADGTLTLLPQATATDPGTVDASASVGGQFLYVQTGGNGIVDAFQVNADGTLTPRGSVTVPGSAGGEGIAAF